MKQIDLPLLIKRYAVVSMLAIVLSVLGVYILTHSFYIISSDSKVKFTVKAYKDTEEAGVSQLLSLYAAPNGVTSLHIESVRDEKSPNPTEQIIKPLARYDTGLGIRNIPVKFTHQYDLQSNGNSTEQCSFGEYPKLFSYTCDMPQGMVSYDASDPFDTGTYTPFPPATIDVMSGVLAPSPERLINAERYMKGLLVLIADETGTMFDYSYKNLRLKYIDEHGTITDKTLPDAPATSESGQHRLITDTSGSAAFSLIDDTNHTLAVYSSLDAKPVAVKPTLSFVGLSLTLLCDINTSALVCYNGIWGDYADSDEEAEALENAREGVLEVFNTSDGKQTAKYTVPKDQALSSICIDKDRRVYTSTGDVFEIMTEDGDNLMRNPVLQTATDFTCGSQVHVVANNKLYVMKDNGDTAHLVYSSGLFSVASVQSFGDNVSITGSFKSRPHEVQSYTATATDKPYSTARVSDAVSRVIDENKGTSFVASFTKSSIDYILPFNVPIKGPQKDAILKSTQKHKLPFEPAFHMSTEEY